MSLNDTLSNTLSSILNSEKVGKSECSIPQSSKLIKEVLNLMKNNEYIGEFNDIEGTNGQKIKVQLMGRVNKCGSIKPRFSVRKDNFEKYEKRFLPAKNFGILIVSTQKGIMTHLEAIEKGLGGRLLAYCY
ncbi:30S ribosomal protein S8 [Candidatus Woesearchaeota archaeon]|nr:hypothetical protein [uncultured archaeon]AQS32293.1 hypothetical protein [uncultured archaeon]MBS3149408.1 30S ribosomal protein S8 [Candidatus Woesearchaeota archaeon]